MLPHLRERERGRERERERGGGEKASVCERERGGGGCERGRERASQSARESEMERARWRERERRDNLPCSHTCHTLKPEPVCVSTHSSQSLYVCPHTQARACVCVHTLKPEPEHIQGSRAHACMHGTHAPEAPCREASG